MNHFDLHAAVAEFHRAIAQGIGESPGIRDAALRYELIREELEEFRVALMQNNLVEAADALADLAYVVMGGFVTFGIDPNPVLAEVHRSNMSKAGGGKREDGKIKKGPNYSPPDLARVIGEQLKKAQP